MEPSTNKTSPALPIAIIFGFSLIAIAIFFTNNNKPVPVAIEQAKEQKESNIGIRPVDETDYIYGNPNAPIIMIEYSDYECPFCKQYHTTMNQIMEEYGVTGKVAWVYRQFPLVELHPNATRLSEAALCVGELGGNEAFWTFTNQVFEERDINAPTNITKLPQYVLDAGVSMTDYTECAQSERMQDDVLASAEEAFKIGARGTPYTVIMVGDQEAVISGAQPYSVVKGIVKNLIDQLDGVATTLTPETTP